MPFEAYNPEDMEILVDGKPVKAFEGNLDDVLSKAPPAVPDIADDEAFKERIATGMRFGSVADSGNLRAIFTLGDGEVVLVEIPHAWLHAEGGARDFIEKACWPGKPRGGA